MSKCAAERPGCGRSSVSSLATHARLPRPRRPRPRLHPFLTARARRCWARLSWHPDPQLLSEVARRFADPAHLASLGACELVRGVWGLSALDALGPDEVALAAPRIRQLAPEMDQHQLRALARALAPAVGADGSGGGGGGGGDAELAGLAQELSARADQLQAEAGAT